MSVLEASGGVEVRVDPSTLRAEVAGGDSTRYRVGLTRSVDERWARTYVAVQSDSTAFRRFRLELASSSISFSCRTPDGPALVMETLERLDELLDLVNRQAEREGVPGPAES